MTHFNAIPHSENFRMESAMGPQTANTIRSISTLGNISLTSAVEHVAEAHRLYEEKCRAVGGLLLATNGREAHVLVPALVESPIEDPATFVALEVQVRPPLKHYLEQRSNSDDPYDLIDFWDSASHLYSAITEYEALGYELYRLMPDMQSDLVRTPRLLGS